MPQPRAFTPSPDDKARINAVAEAVAFERFYQTTSQPLVSREVRLMVEEAAISAGADPKPQQPRQQSPSQEAAASDAHGHAFIRLTRQLLVEVASGRGGGENALLIAQSAMKHDQLMRAGYQAPGARRPKDGSEYVFTHDGIQQVFSLHLGYSRFHRHLIVRHSSELDVDDAALMDFGRWATSMSPEERERSGRAPDRAELIYREHKGSLVLRDSIAGNYAGLPEVLHALALSARPVIDVPPD